MKISTKVFLGFAIILFLSLSGFFIQYKLTQEVARNIGFVSNSEAVIRNSSNLYKSLVEMQASTRGFLLTNNEMFLEPYHDGLKTYSKLVNEQKKLIGNSPEQLGKIDSIVILHLQWLNYSESLIKSKKESAYDKKGLERYNNVFTNKLLKGEGIRFIRQVKKLFQEFEKAEYHKREIRRVALKKSLIFANISSIVIIIINILVAMLIGYIILNTISERISSMVGYAEEISKGNFIVIQDTKNDELTRLSKSLNTMSSQLSESFKELNEKNKDLDQFAYATSHDLKAPLRGMYNIITWIEEDLGNSLPEQLWVYLNKLKGRISRLEQIINGLLEYARISRKERVLEDTNVQEMILNLADMLIPDHFRTIISNKVTIIKTEKILLQQVFTNLISNAVKFQNKPGKECIEIEGVEKKDFYVFSVSDNGTGISKEYYDKIFVLFQTLREKNDSEDTGIGLSIVKKLVEERKGKVFIKSTPGEGSKFTFTWPK